MAAMSLLAAAPRGDGHPVLVVPGLSSSPVNGTGTLTRQTMLPGQLLNLFSETLHRPFFSVQMMASTPGRSGSRPR